MVDDANVILYFALFFYVIFNFFSKKNMINRNIDR